MSRIQKLLEVRRLHHLYDEELWQFMHSLRPRNLINLTDEELNRRLFDIERSIQYLDSETTPRDKLPPERGWLSPWWWWRARYWTLVEYEFRGLLPESLSKVPVKENITPEFIGVVSGGGGSCSCV